MKTTLTSLLLCVSMAALGQQGPPAEADPEQLLLKRIYELRLRFERERAQAENEARSNVRLVTQAPGVQVDSPTVSSMRNRSSTQLAVYEQRFRCLDVNVEPNGGNTVVICGDNSGDINGTNVAADRDVVTVVGEQP